MISQDVASAGPAETPVTPLDDVRDAYTGEQPPSQRYLAFDGMSRRELERAFVRGHTPELDALVGWTFRGMNTPAWAKLAGIKKFVKGFYRRPGTGDVYGYNCPVMQNRLDAVWLVKHEREEPKRFGFYSVSQVDPTARDNAYLHAVLLDYGRGANPVWDPSRGLRDYLVQVDPDDPDLFLGKAYFAIGPLRTPGVSYFVLERLAPGPAELER